MKGKTFTYVLIVCVAAVWGLIIYRIYSAVNEEEEPLLSTNGTKVPYFKMVDHQYDQVQLELGYRDPFMAAVSYEGEDKKKYDQPIGKVIATKVIPNKPVITWPSVSYTGYINNPDTKQRTVLITVNGNAMLLKDGQSVNGLRLLKNWGDSIKVQFHNETKILKLK